MAGVRRGEDEGRRKGDRGSDQRKDQGCGDAAGGCVKGGRHRCRKRGGEGQAGRNCRQGDLCSGADCQSGCEIKGE